MTSTRLDMMNGDTEKEKVSLACSFQQHQKTDGGRGARLRGGTSPFMVPGSKNGFDTLHGIQDERHLLRHV